MCVFHSSQFTFMTRNQAAQPPNIIVDTKSVGNSAPDLVSKSVVAFQANFRFFAATFLRWCSASRLSSSLFGSHGVNENALRDVCYANAVNGNSRVNFARLFM